MRGATVCSAHGGRAPQVKRAADRRVQRAQAVAEWSTVFGQPLDQADPTDVVLGEIRHASGHVKWLREQVTGLKPSADALGGVVVELYGEWSDRLVKMCRIAAAMGIEERRVVLAEQVGGVLVDAIRAVLDDLELSAVQRQVAAEAVPRHLRAVSVALALPAAG